MRLSSEDVASVGIVLGALKMQAAALHPASRIAHLWRDWIDLLEPTADVASDGMVRDRALLIALDQTSPPHASGE